MAKRIQFLMAGYRIRRQNEKTKPTDGFEPSTPGLQNQSSTIELRWHQCPEIYAKTRFSGCFSLYSIGLFCKKFEDKLRKLPAQNRNSLRDCPMPGRAQADSFSGMDRGEYPGRVFKFLSRGRKIDRIREDNNRRSGRVHDRVLLRKLWSED